MRHQPSCEPSWKTGFGPYPTAAFSVVNKYNQHRNITPTAIAMFPLSILRNLTGLYLSPNIQFLSGTLVAKQACAEA